MEELLAKDEEELPMSDTKWQRRRELIAKVKEQASSEEDENPAAPPPGGSVFTKALKVSEGLYQFSEDQMAGVLMRPRPLGSADCRPRTSSGS